MIKLPNTLHIDINGTLLGWNIRTGTGFLQPYAREVTHLLSENHNIIALTMAGGFDGPEEIEKEALDYNTEFINKYFPWFDHVEHCKGNKGEHPGVEYLIDDTSWHFDSRSSYDGILLNDRNARPSYIRNTIITAKDWLTIALYLKVTE